MVATNARAASSVLLSFLSPLTQKAGKEDARSPSCGGPVNPLTRMYVCGQIAVGLL